MFVIKIGGSLLFDDNEQINDKLISKYANTIRNVFNEKNSRCVVVVGGGKIARKYIAKARSLGATEAYNDVFGIEIAKLNARLLISALGEIAYPNPPDNYVEFQHLWNSTSKIIVCGGFTPGQSTNAVASVVAEDINAKKLINVTNVNGVYSKDPKKHKNAELLQNLTIEEFVAKFSSNNTTAGYYPLFDGTAMQIIKRSKIPVQFINGIPPINLQKAIDGKTIGTLVKP